MTPDNIIRLRRGLAIGVAVAAGVFLAVAKHALDWSDGTVLAVGVAMAALIGFLGAPLVLLPLVPTTSDWREQVEEAAAELVAARGGRLALDPTVETNLEMSLAANAATYKAIVESMMEANRRLPGGKVAAAYRVEKNLLRAKMSEYVVSVYDEDFFLHGTRAAIRETNAEPQSGTVVELRPLRDSGDQYDEWNVLPLSRLRTRPLAAG